MSLQAVTESELIHEQTPGKTDASYAAARVGLEDYPGNLNRPGQNPEMYAKNMACMQVNW